MSTKFFNLILLMLLTSIQQSIVRSAITKCEKSVTTTSGLKAVNEKKLCSGDLIFEESFDGILDMDIWQHDITFTGDSVREYSSNGIRKELCKYLREFLKAFHFILFLLQDHEFQWYTNNRSNSFVEDGNLNIRPTLTADDFDEYFLYTGILDLHGLSNER